MASLRRLAAAAALALAPGCSDSAGAGGGAAHDPNSLLIANWNVHNLIDDKLNSGTSAETADPAYVAHRKEVARVVDPLAIDVLMLAEVESQGVLDALNGDLAAPFAQTKLIDGNDPRAIDVGIMSRLPLVKVVSHASETFTKLGTKSPVYSYARDCLEVHLDAHGHDLVLLGVHFRSKDNDDPNKRLAEAQHTRQIADAILKAEPNAEVLVLGDFNDVPASPPLAAISAGTPPFVDAADSVAAADRWSFVYQGMNQLIDHQTGSPSLAKLLEPASVTLVHSKQVSAASDHSPLLARYDFD